MPRRILQAIGKLKPWKPTRSLPSYKEPTPETTRKLSREEEAEIALKNTVFTTGTPALLIALFLVTIISVPLIQLAAELGGARSSVFDVFKVLPSGAQLKAVRTPGDVWRLLPHAEDLKAAEEDLEKDSVVSQRLLPRVQSLLTGRLGAGNEQVYLGRDGWLFYRQDVEYVTGARFLAPRQLKQRASGGAIQPDPVKAIVQFRDQLAARGIALVIVPVPTKATVEPQMLSARAPSDAALQNPSFAEFLRQLGGAGVRVFDPTPLLMERKAAAPGAPLYLATDTHWRPDTMELVAQALASSLDLRAAAADSALRVVPREHAGIGDIARMLKLPDVQQLYPPETVTIRQVIHGNALWRPDPAADVLVLGDSFANIFSQEALGWGESAGLVEHLSNALGGRKLDAILRNSDAAFATREILANDLARGRDRLAGKKVVIWEFAARELAFGNWKLLDLKLGTPAPSRFFSPAPGETVEVSGIVEAISTAPRPGSVPYKDHIVAVHLTMTKRRGQPTDESLQAIVYLRSMRDNEWTDAARLRPGDEIRLRLRAWSDVAAEYEQINRTDIDDPALQLEEPVWGELIR